MVSCLHFPYILRSVHHAVYSDVALRSRFSLLGKRWFLMALLLAHTIYAVVYFLVFSSGRILGQPHDPVVCAFKLEADGSYMFATLVYYVGCTIWSTVKVWSFDDKFQISCEIMYVYLIWIILAVPYLVFQIFIEDRVAAAWCMVAMNFLLLIVSFYYPSSQKGPKSLAHHP
ncbi:unnamed protein product, partial [Heterosigma akashiwo]